MMIHCKGWLAGYRASTHTLAGMLTVLQAAYLADADVQHFAHRLLGAHPMAQMLCGYCLVVAALYRNGATQAGKQEMEKNNGK
jgi:hypothetical protein